MNTPFKMKNSALAKFAKVAGSPIRKPGSSQEVKVEKGKEYVDSDTKVVRSDKMQRLMDNKPAATDKEALASWQKSYDRAKAEFIASKKK